MDGQAYNITPVNKYVFEFPSIGKKNLVKQISFDEIEDGIYNVALGTVLETGKVNYKDSTNNGDIVKVFCTVVNCIKIFVNNFPERVAFFTGDTEQKTRVYNEILRRHYDEFSIDFNIFGVYIKDGRSRVHKFNNNMNYVGFYLKAKK